MSKKHRLTRKKRRFPLDVTRFFNSPGPKLDPGNFIGQIVYPLKERELHIPAVAGIGRDGRKHYYPMW